MYQCVIMCYYKIKLINYTLFELQCLFITFILIIVLILLIFFIFHFKLITFQHLIELNIFISFKSFLILFSFYNNLYVKIKLFFYILILFNITINHKLRFILLILLMQSFILLLLHVSFIINHIFFLL